MRPYLVLMSDGMNFGWQIQGEMPKALLAAAALSLLTLAQKEIGGGPAPVLAVPSGEKPPSELVKEELARARGMQRSGVS